MERVALRSWKDKIGYERFLVTIPKKFVNYLGMKQGDGLIFDVVVVHEEKCLIVKKDKSLI